MVVQYFIEGAAEFYAVEAGEVHESYCVCLSGLNRIEFRRALDELFHNHPTGRFPDPAALMSQLQSWQIANSLTIWRVVEWG